MTTQTTQVPPISIPATAPASNPTAPTGTLGTNTVSQGAVAGARPLPLPPTNLPQERNGATAISLHPSIHGTTSSLASLNQKDHPKVHTYVTETKWKGKRYELTLEIPLDKPKNQMDPNELEKASKEFAAIFLEDLKKQLEPSSSIIKPGENFHVIFDNQGYVAFKPGDQFDPNNISREEITKTCPNVLVSSDQAKELSQMIESGKTETFHERLAKPQFESLKPAAQSTKATPFTPVNLVHNGANCYINSAFQQFVTNPAFRNELSNENNFIGGQENCLYKAIKGYFGHQTHPKNGKYELPQDLIESLHLNPNEQGDPQDVWAAFQDQLEENSALAQLLAAPILIGDATKPIQHFLQEKVEGNYPKPKTISLQFSRLNLTTAPLTEASDDAKNQLITDLHNHASKSANEIGAINQFCTNHQIANLTTNLSQEELTRTYQLVQNLSSNTNGRTETLKQLNRILGFIELQSAGIDLHANDNPPDCDRILQNDQTWASACKILTDKERSQFHKSRQVKRTKNENLLNIEPTLTVTDAQGIETTYELTSFTKHIGDGNSGHYIAYIRNEKGQYVKANDLADGRECEPISLETLKIEAKSGSFFIFNQKEVDPNAQIEESSKKAQNKRIDEKKILDLTNLVTEVGSMDGIDPQTTRVNWTNELLATIDPVFSSAEQEPLKTAMSDAKIAAGQKKWFNKKTLELSNGVGKVYDSPPSLISTSMQSHQVLHCVVHSGNDLSRANKKKLIQRSVKTVLQKALDSGTQNIALPLISLQDYSKQNAYNEMVQAITNFVEANKTCTTLFKTITILGQKKEDFENVPVQTAPPTEPITPPTPAPKAAPAQPELAGLTQSNEIQLSDKTSLFIQQSKTPSASSTYASKATPFKQLFKQGFDAQNETLLFDFTARGDNDNIVEKDNTARIPCDYTRRDMKINAALSEFKDQLVQYTITNQNQKTILLRLPSDVDQSTIQSIVSDIQNRVEQEANKTQLNIPLPTSPTPPAPTDMQTTSKPSYLMSRAWNQLTSIGSYLQG